MKNSFFFITALLFCTALFSQELLLEDGIYYEKPVSGDTNIHRYSIDNISYKLNRTYIFDYYYKDKTGIKKKFLLKDKYTNENPMNVVNYDNRSDSVIDKVKLEVTDQLIFFAGDDSTYTQTVVGFSYLNSYGKRKDTLCEGMKRRSVKKKNFPCEDEGTGIIDNKMNVWMHPPRSHGFKILELSPFPFYYLDESVKNWNTKLEVGGLYLDPRWITHKDVITLKYKYIRANDEVLTTPMGNIVCKVTNAVANSEYGRSFMKSYLKSYYNLKYGFVKLEYININGSKLVLDLVEMKE